MLAHATRPTHARAQGLAPQLLLQQLIPALLLLALLSGSSSAWFSPDLQLRNRVELTTRPIATLEDCVVLLKWNSSIIDLSPAGGAPDGTDLVFVSADDSTVYPHEIEVYGGEPHVWIKLPVIVPEDPDNPGIDFFWVYLSNVQWNNGSSVLPAALFATTDTWSGYDRVFHMDSTSQLDVLHDSCADGEDISLELGNIPTSMTGVVGPAYNFDGTAQFLGALHLNQSTVPVSDMSLSLEGWVETPDCTGEVNDGNVMFALQTLDQTPDTPSKAAEYFYLRMMYSLDCTQVQALSGRDKYGQDATALAFSTILSPNDWHHVALVINKRTLTEKQQVQMFIDGKLTAIYIIDLATPVDELRMYVGGPYLVRCSRSNCKGTDYFRNRMSGGMDELRFATFQAGDREEPWFQYQVPATLGQAVSLDGTACRFVSAANSSASIDASGAVPAGTTVSGLVRARDVLGNDLTGTCLDPFLEFGASLRGGLGSTATTKTTYADGSDYSFSFQVTTADSYTVEVDLDGQFVSAAAFIVEPSGTAPSESQLVFPGGASALSMTDNTTASIEVLTFDEYQNRRHLGGDVVTVNITVLGSNAGDASSVSTVVRDFGNGNYSVRFSTNVVGQYSAMILVNGQKAANVFSLIVSASADPGGTDPPGGNNSGGSSSSDNGAAMAGIVGAVLGAVLLAILAVIGRRKYKKYIHDKPPDLTDWAFQLDQTSLAFAGFGEEAADELRQLLLEADYQLPQAIITSVSSKKLNEAIKAVFFFYYCQPHQEQHNKPMVMMKNFITDKVAESMAAGTSNLFRTDNEATKSMGVFMRMVGLPYLYATIGLIVKDMEDVSAELDPTRMDAGQDSDLSRYTILQMAQKVFVSINSSLKRMPPELRDVARHLDSEVRKNVLKLHEDGEMTEETMAHVDNTSRVALAGMFFLRYFCPALSAPQAFGFIDDRPSPDKRRMLTIMTKTMQNLANGVRFGAKEQYMLQLNDFMDSNAEKINTYFARVVGNEPGDRTEDEPERVKPPPAAINWSMVVIFRILHDNLDYILGRIQPHLRERLKRAVALSVPPIPPASEWKKVGWMVKQGGRIKTWKRRWFILGSGGFLWYCKDEVDRKLIPEAGQKKRKDDEEVPVAQGVICLEGTSVLEKEDGFAIDHPHSRTYEIRMCDDATTTEKAAWVEALRKAIVGASRGARERQQSVMVGNVPEQRHRKTSSQPGMPDAVELQSGRRKASTAPPMHLKLLSMNDIPEDGPASTAQENVQAGENGEDDGEEGFVMDSGTGLGGDASSQPAAAETDGGGTVAQLPTSSAVEDDDDDVKEDEDELADAAHVPFVSQDRSSNSHSGAGGGAGVFASSSASSLAAVAAAEDVHLASDRSSSVAAVEEGALEFSEEAANSQMLPNGYAIGHTGWRVYYTEDDVPYYYQELSGESSWTLPDAVRQAMQ